MEIIVVQILLIVRKSGSSSLRSKNVKERAAIFTFNKNQVPLRKSTKNPLSQLRGYQQSSFPRMQKA